MVVNSHWSTRLRVGNSDIKPETRALHVAETLFCLLLKARAHVCMCAHARARVCVCECAHFEEKCDLCTGYQVKLSNQLSSKSMGPASFV